jgi:hypothetical protein
MFPLRVVIESLTEKKSSRYFHCKWSGGREIIHVLRWAEDGVCQGRGLRNDMLFNLMFDVKSGGTSALSPYSRFLVGNVAGFRREIRWYVVVLSNLPRYFA